MNTYSVARRLSAHRKTALVIWLQFFGIMAIPPITTSAQELTGCLELVPEYKTLWTSMGKGGWIQFDKRELENSSPVDVYLSYHRQEHHYWTNNYSGIGFSIRDIGAQYSIDRLFTYDPEIDESDTPIDSVIYIGKLNEDGTETSFDGTTAPEWFHHYSYDFNDIYVDNGLGEFGDDYLYYAITQLTLYPEGETETNFVGATTHIGGFEVEFSTNLTATSESLYHHHIWQLTETLSSLYTTPHFIEVSTNYLNTLDMPDDWSSDAGRGAFLALQADETHLELGKMDYRLKFTGEAGQEYNLEWIERFTPEDGGPAIDTKVTEKITATGKVQYTTTRSVSSPLTSGTITLVMPKVSQCTECIPGSDSPKNACVDFSIKLGRATDGGSAGTLFIYELLPTNSLFAPTSLHCDHSPDVHVTFDSGHIKRVYAPEAVADVLVVTNYAYEVRLYHPADVPATEPWNPAPTPFAVWRFSNPDASGVTSNRLDIVKTADGLTVTNAYSWSGLDQAWTLSTGNGLRKETKATLLDAPTGDEIETVVIRNQLDQITYKESRRYHAYADPLGRVLLSKVVDPDGAARTTTFQYYTNAIADGLHYGKLKLIIHDTGAWTRYDYNDGLLAKEVSGFLNAAPDAAENLCRVLEYSYTSVDAEDNGSLDPQIPRCTTEKLLGQIIAKRFYVAVPGERREIQCLTTNAAANDPANLVTITKTYTQGDERLLGKTRLIDHPDGTRDVSFYAFFDATNGTFSFVTNTVLRGAPDPGNETNVLDGTRTITVTTDTGHLIASKIVDIVSGVTLSEETYSNFDAFTRPRRIAYLDGTYIDMSYGCCSVDTITNRDGTIVSYEYDALKRRYAEHRNVGASSTISTVSTLDPDAHQITLTRVGTDNSSMTLSTSTYDLASQPTATTDALNHTTRFTNYVDASGQTIKITTYPDTGTRIEVYAKDGSILSISGTAVAPANYLYGADAGGVYKTEVRLALNGGTNEWTKTYTDMAGRAYKTVFASAAGTPLSISYFNLKGQLTNQVDPDGVSLLYAYNAKGEQTFSVIDSNRNYAIDFSGTDRITFTTNDVVSDNGTYVRRIRTYLWSSSADQSTLISTTDISVDGLQTWTTLWNNGNGITRHSKTLFDSAHALKVISTTNADNSYVLMTNQYGRLISLTRRDANNAQIGQTIYGYDAHGRQNTIADGRNGTTTYFFNNADQISGTKSPVPAVGQNAQVTTNYFDNMGRIWKTTLADNTSVTNEFFTNGLLKKTYGSRTYPVEYTYDGQGRMRTMKTWKNFSGNSGTATTTWTYDDYRGRLSSKTYDGGSAGPAYTYTAAGRLQTRLWARGTNTTYSYNYAGDLSSIAYNDGVTPGVGYDYDRRGRQTMITNGAQVCSLAYNDASSLLGEAYLSGPLAGLTVSNIYDTLLRRTTNGLWDGSAWRTQTRFTYDPASRLKSIGDGTNSASYDYVANSSLVGQISFTNNGAQRMVTSKAYDLLNRLTNITSTAGGSTVAGFVYQNNDANQRTRRTEPDGSYWVYTYDSLGQVTSGKKYWSDDTPVAGQQFEYAFDDIGNRTSVAFGGDPSGVNLDSATYAANNLNQYTNRTVPGVLALIGTANSNATVSLWASDGNYAATSRKGDYYWGKLSWANLSALWYSVTNLAVLPNGSSPDIVSSTSGNVFLRKTPEQFTYDADGNLTGEGRWTNKWDAENRLILMFSLTNAPSGSKRRLTFGYDYQGRRITKSVETWTGSAWSITLSNKFVYDRWNLIAELNGTNNAVIRSYTWGLDLSGTEQGTGGVGGLMEVTDAAQGTHFVAFDGNGNVWALLKASDGSTSARYEYGPFGESLRASGGMAKDNPFKFSTKGEDSDTGFLYYGYRLYNPDFGRWVNRDPASEFGSGGENLYAFVGNDPGSYFDILGLEVGPKLNPSDISCCTSTEEKTGEQTLDASYERLRSDLESRGIPHYSPEADYSCDTLKDLIFDALTPIPKCWFCRSERRQNTAIIRMSADHWQVICRSYRGKEIAFDYWLNRPTGEDPNNFFYKKYGPVMKTQDFNNNTYVNNSHSTCSLSGIKRPDPVGAQYPPTPKIEPYPGPQYGP